jgi:hypothetical protein
LGASNGGEDWDQASGLITIPTVAITKLKKLISASVQASTKACDLAAAQEQKRRVT